MLNNSLLIPSKYFLDIFRLFCSRKMFVMRLCRPIYIYVRIYVYIPICDTHLLLSTHKFTKCRGANFAWPQRKRCSSMFCNSGESVEWLFVNLCGGGDVSPTFPIRPPHRSPMFHIELVHWNMPVHYPQPTSSLWVSSI